jgi:Family of unknown function (DUF6194)
MTETEIIAFVSNLDGAVAMTASAESGAPEVAWGDSFFYYDPDDSPTGRQLPFATIVTQNYPGFDMASDLDRPGVFRLNLAVGRARFEQLFGFPPAEFATHQDAFDFTVLDQLIPHPVYAKQGWASILVPGERTGEQALDLIAHARQRAKDRYRPPK